MTALAESVCPDHSPKSKLFTLLDPTKIGMGLTENGAMTPAASVSGLYFGHPQASYFGVGRIGKDQVEDYAQRTGMAVSEAEHWLMPSLGYDPQ